jgi:uncharacterized membrane protein
MKKIFLIVLLALSLGFLTTRVAYAQSVEERIDDFAVQATLTADRLLRVTETIQYDFGTNEKHGIYRDIPESYNRNGGVYKLRFRVVDVRVDGELAQFSVSHGGGSLEVKIGNPNQTIQGKHVYSIVYTTDRAINEFVDHQELYWNVTGNGWIVPISHASFTLLSPRDPTKTICYTGYEGSQASRCAVDVTSSSLRIETSEPLETSEGLTVAIAFPLGTFPSLSWVTRVWEFLQDNWFLGLPILTFLVMLFAWSRWGKEPRGRGTIIAQYEEPRGLTPALIVGLMKQNVPMEGMVATILDIARRGFLKVKFEKEKGPFSIVKDKTPLPGDLLPYESAFLAALLPNGELVYELGHASAARARACQDARSQAVGELMKRGFFRENPERVRGMWVAIAIGMGVLGYFLRPSFGSELFFVGVLVSAVIILLFGWQMPKMTQEGAIANEECEGFKQFLTVTEKARLAFSDTPDKKPEQFARFLPVAVALGVEKQWAKQFESMTLATPSYFDTPLGTWTSFAMLNSFHGLGQGLSRSMSPPATSSAGGGGFGFSGGGSGGGFGGGGGGSW